MNNCANCGRPIEKIIDPWGYDNYQGHKYGWYHPDLVDGATDGRNRSGSSCDDGNEAEPVQGGE